MMRVRKESVWGLANGVRGFGLPPPPALRPRDGWLPGFSRPASVEGRRCSVTSARSAGKLGDERTITNTNLIFRPT